MSSLLHSLAGSQYGIIPLRWHWVLAIESAGLLVAYGIIARQFWRDARRCPASGARDNLTRLVWIFLLCGVCGYGTRVASIWWPTWKLQIGLLLPLNFYAWAFALRGGLRSVTVRLSEVEEARADAERYRHICDSLPIMSWTADPAGFVRAYNRQWFDYTGTTAEQAEGWGWTRVHHPDYLAGVLERWKQCLATGEPYEFECPLRAADGRFRWFLTRVRPMRDNAGTIVMWFGCNIDLDHKHRGEEQRRVMERARDEQFQGIIGRLQVVAGKLDAAARSREETADASE